MKVIPPDFSLDFLNGGHPSMKVIESYMEIIIKTFPLNPSMEAFEYTMEIIFLIIYFKSLYGGYPSMLVIPPWRSSLPGGL